LAPSLRANYLHRGAHRPLRLLVLRLVIVAMVVFGAVHEASLAWALGDIGVGLMAWLNIVAILLLHKPALAALRDYERQRRLGVEPVFDPDALGIRNADYWRERLAAGAVPQPDARGSRDVLASPA
jgi:AGCS family alanine or glycine:cation symporter